MFLFVDGTLDVSQPAMGLMAQNTIRCALEPTRRGCIRVMPAYFFNGLVDEVSLYNRGLTASEIQAIYAAGSAGKCPPSPMPPSITAQPTNQTVNVGGSATFSVTASGTPPLSYQWNFDGTNISGATNPSLTLTNVQMNQTGNYTVLVTNAYGAILSSNAVLTVNPPPPCDPPPSGLVDWWPGEGNANDVFMWHQLTARPLAGHQLRPIGEVERQAFVFRQSVRVSIPCRLAGLEPSDDRRAGLPSKLGFKPNAACRRQCVGVTDRRMRTWHAQPTGDGPLAIWDQQAHVVSGGTCRLDAIWITPSPMAVGTSNAPASGASPTRIQHRH